jgi:DNA mismatch repair protein MutS2
VLTPGIEWPAVQALLARDAYTPMGRELALALAPFVDLAAIQAALARTREARLALGAAGVPPWEVIPDVRPTLHRARMDGSVLDGSDLRGLIPLIDAAGRLQAYGRAVAPVAPGLSADLVSLPALRPLGDRLRHALDEEGLVRDEASPALRRLRQRVRDLRHDIVRRLEGYFQGPGAEHAFQERYVTVRHGRYVLPVLASAKGRVRGIVHDRSQSGATLFVEPEALVDANNDLAQATREEEMLVLAILTELTAQVREALPDIGRLVEKIGELDLAFAKGTLADRMDATEPAMGDARTVELAGARHPLLLAQSWQEPARTIVPVDIFLDAERPLLVITGPNAGGKTVTLKTLGVLATMAQAGCHVPAREGARLPVFSGIFAIVGDDQSVAENLSTFSAFVKQLRAILEAVDTRALVLLDELGAGTDPDDGAALAQAVLEELAGRGVLCIASTHLEPLKGFAATYPKARNASVEFDGERLEPTFRLVYDRPGQSYALAIGARLGLPAGLIERAASHRGTHQRALQELIASLDARDRRDAERAALIDRREAESASLLARAQAELEAARAEAHERVTRARTEAQRQITDVRRVVNEEWDRLRRSERTREGLERSRRRLTEAAQRVSDPGPAEDTETPGEEARVGDRVQVPHLNLRGDVLSVDGATATVRAGAVTVKVPVQALHVSGRAGGAAGPVRSGPRAEGVRLPVKSGVNAEIHLIGRTTDEARDLLEKYLDDAFLAGLATVRIIHGKGTGALRRTVHELLAGHPLVAEHRDGAPQEGGGGATVAQLKIS